MTTACTPLLPQETSGGSWVVAPPSAWRQDAASRERQGRRRPRRARRRPAATRVGLQSKEEKEHVAQGLLFLVFIRFQISLLSSLLDALLDAPFFRRKARKELSSFHKEGYVLHTFPHIILDLVLPLQNSYVPSYSFRCTSC